ncbi:MAG: hypothetical protein ACREBJ_11050 [Nitrosotalea sp.]
MFKKTLEPITPQTQAGKAVGAISGVAVVAYVIHMLHIGTTILSVFVLAFATAGAIWVCVRRIEKLVCSMLGVKTA